MEEMVEQEVMQLAVVNPHAAGIDIGSRSHWVAVGQGENDIREFGVYNEDLFEMVAYLKERLVRTIAIESTGTYWQNLYSVLISQGFHVILCNGKYTKNIKGKKTDIKDCQWIQRLHSLGLLSNSFLPEGETEQLRTYCRHRSNLIYESANTSKKMQKYLRLMNLRLDIVVKDVCGLTGLSIIRAICQGETNAEKLSSLRHYNCKKSQAEIRKALQWNGREDYLFALQHELGIYDHLQSKIGECDVKISEKLNQIIDKDENKKQHHIDSKPYKRINKNTPKDIDLNLKSYQMLEGTDLLAIEGMSYSTVLALISEVGVEGIRKFPSAKQFASWLRLAPNNKVSGGKVLSSRLPKGSNRLKIALRNAANAIGNLKDSTPLRDFFMRINFRKGRVSAISATARKLAIIIWNMVVHRVPYNNPAGYNYLDEKRKLGIVKRIRKQIIKFELKAEDVGFCNSLIMSV